MANVSVNVVVEYEIPDTLLEEYQDDTVALTEDLIMVDIDGASSIDYWVPFQN